MDANNILFQSLGSIGSIPQYYTYTDTVSQFVNLIWTDNTIKQQPCESIKNLLLNIYELLSVSSTCVYGIPKNAQYPRYICPASSAAASYSFYVSSIVSHLSNLPLFLDAVRSEIAGIINGTTTEAAFYDTCFGLLKINNFIHFLVESADPLTKNFSDNITIQPLLPQIDQITMAVKEIVSRSDQLRNLVVNKTATAQDVTSFNDTVNSFIGIIPQYTQLYTSLLEQLRNEFQGIYSSEKKDENKGKDESKGKEETSGKEESKAAEKKSIEDEFNAFIQKNSRYVYLLQKVVLLASELLTQKPTFCDNLLLKIKACLTNFNQIILNYSIMMHFRGDEFDQYKKTVYESLKQNLVIFKEIKNEFNSILSTDVPPCFHKYMTEGLKDSITVITETDAYSFQAEFDKLIKMISSDPRSIVFNPVLSTSIQLNQLGSLSLKAIQILHSLSLQLQKEQLNFQDIKGLVNDLHPTIKYLLTVVYNEIHKNMVNKTKTSKKKKAAKARNFTIPPDIKTLTQKRTFIENLFVSFDESLRKLSPDNKILRIIQDNCSLKAILLAIAIGSLESSLDIQKETSEIYHILINYADNYFKNNELKINEIINFFKDEKNIPGNQKSQFTTVAYNLLTTASFSKKVFTQEKNISEINDEEGMIELTKKKVAEYEKLSLIFSSLQYIDESYFPDNCYHETIVNLQQNMTNIVKSFQNVTQLYAFQSIMSLDKIFSLILKLITNILPHSFKETNYSNIISVDLNRNIINMIKLNSCGIGFDPDSYKFLKAEIQQNLQFIKEEKEFYQTKIETHFFKTILDKSFETLDEFYQKAEKSFEYLQISEVDYNIPQRDCIGPILKHFTLLINYTFDKYALALINNLPNVVQLAMNLNDLLHELDKALRYIPKSKNDDMKSLLSVSELEKIQSKFECPGKILFQLTSEIPLLNDYFKDDKVSLNIALQSKKEIITEAITNVMNYLKKIVTFTQLEICKFEDIELNRQKTEYELLVEQSQKEYQEFRKELFEKGKKIEDYRKEVSEKERIEKLKEEKERLEKELKEKKELEDKQREEEQKKLLYKEPNSDFVNSIFGMGLYQKCGFNIDSIKLDVNSDADMDISVNIEELSDFSSIPSIHTSFFENAAEVRSESDATKSKENKNLGLINELQRQLMPPDYLLTAIECGLLKERQDNNNDDMMNEDDEDDEEGGGIPGISLDDDDENGSGEFDSENDPILGNRNLVEDDDEFFESCSDDDDDDEEEENKGFFPW